MQLRRHRIGTETLAEYNEAIRTGEEDAFGKEERSASLSSLLRDPMLPWTVDVAHHDPHARRPRGR